MVKFDTTYPHGDKEDTFARLCAYVHGAPNFLVGVVPVAEHGPRWENDDLRQRFKLEVKDFPVYLIFNGSSTEYVAKYKGLPFHHIHGSADKYEDYENEQTPWDHDVSFGNFIRWLRGHGA